MYVGINLILNSLKIHWSPHAYACKKKCTRITYIFVVTSDLLYKILKVRLSINWVNVITRCAFDVKWQKFSCSSNKSVKFGYYWN